MNLPFQIALKYFKSSKRTQAINIVSWISLGAVALSTTAMIVLFSVYNGLESYVKSMYTAFYPELKVSAVKGKFFEPNSRQIEAISNIEGVAHLGMSVEDMALLDGRTHQKVVRLKGVNNEWFDANDMHQHINTGTAYWPEGPDVYANIGVDIVAEMGIELDNPFQKVLLYYPKIEAAVGALSLGNALNSLALHPYASFHVQAELDGQYCLIPLEAAQEFYGIGNKISAYEIALKEPKYLKRVQESVSKIMGADFEVLSRIEQNRTLFMATEMEKWMIYGILTMVLIIASFNLVGALSMLAIEKKQDISILKSMGARPRTIKHTFLSLGMLITGTGAITGLALGLIIVLLQMQFGFIEMGEGFATPYPVDIQGLDFAIVLLTVILVGLAAAWYPASKAARQQLVFRDE